MEKGTGEYVGIFSLSYVGKGLVEMARHFSVSMRNKGYAKELSKMLQPSLIIPALDFEAGYQKRTLVPSIKDGVVSYLRNYSPVKYKLIHSIFSIVDSLTNYPSLSSSLSTNLHIVSLMGPFILCEVTRDKDELTDLDKTIKALSHRLFALCEYVSQKEPDYNLLFQNPEIQEISMQVFIAAKALGNHYTIVSIAFLYKQAEILDKLDRDTIEESLGELDKLTDSHPLLGYVARDYADRDEMILALREHYGSIATGAGVDISAVASPDSDDEGYQSEPLSAAQLAGLSDEYYTSQFELGDRREGGQPIYNR